MARRRPSAFEVSFPEDAKRQEALQKKREQDERERKRLEAIIAAQQVDQKKLKRREQERLKQQEREERRGTRAGGTKRPLEVDDTDMEESRPRVSPNNNFFLGEGIEVVCHLCSQLRNRKYIYVCS